MDDLPFEYRRRPLSMAPLFERPMTRVRKTWLALEPHPEREITAYQRIWRGSPDVLFRPEGLMLIDGPERALLHSWCQRGRQLLPIGRTPVRLSLFERFYDRVIDGKDPAKPWFDPIAPGEFVTLDVSDTDGNPIRYPASLTVWGLASEPY